MEDLFDDEAIGVLTALSMPRQVNVYDGWVEQHWVLRLGASVRVEWAAGANVVVAQALDVVRAILRDDAEAGEVPELTAQVRMIDGTHAMLTIGVRSQPGRDRRAGMLAASSLVPAIEALTTIEEVQGIPRAYWKMLFGPASV